MMLAADFPPVSQAQWRQRAEAALNGRPFDSLVYETLDGIRIDPIHARPERALASDAPARPPTVVQRIDIADAESANRQALDDLENGAGGLALVLTGAVTAGQGGLVVGSSEGWRRLLDGVELDLISVRLDVGAAFDLADGLIDLYEARGLDLSRADLTLGLDPLSVMALGGELPNDSRLVERMAALAERLDGFKGKGFLADTRAFHAAGATEAQELAIALANAVQQIRWLERRDMGLAGPLRTIGFLLTADADQFLTVAKLRALRLVWRRAQEAMGLDPEPAVLHVETAWRMLTRRDPHVNLLRNTVAAFAAIVGGADTLTVLPHTLACGVPDAFARRLARNAPTILIEESGVGRVADPAAGSGYVEALTAELARKAWSHFQAIEAQGGLHAALRSGGVQRMLAAAAAARRAAVATRKLPLTGVSEYPNLDDRPAHERATLASTALPQERLSEPFDTLRDAADLYLARHGRRPSVFLARLGSVADFGARTAWVENLLAAGGIVAAGDAAPVTANGAAKAFRASGAAVACLCSSDSLYAAQGPELIRILKNAGASQVLIAGSPGAAEAELRDAGADAFLFAGQDVVEGLTRLHAALGVGLPEAA